jgi:hypothetical protein
MAPPHPHGDSRRFSSAASVATARAWPKPPQADTVGCRMSRARASVKRLKACAVWNASPAAIGIGERARSSA